MYRSFVRWIFLEGNLSFVKVSKSTLTHRTTFRCFKFNSNIIVSLPHWSPKRSLPCKIPTYKSMSIPQNTIRHKKTRTDYYFSHSQVAIVFNRHRHGLNEYHSTTRAHLEQQAGLYLLNYRKEDRWKLNVKYHKRIWQGRLVINTIRRVS